MLFVCARNGGKSQMAAGLMKKEAGDLIDTYSAGTDPGEAINQLSAESLLEVGWTSPVSTPNRSTRTGFTPSIE